jgi:hypothetical protein
MAGGTPALHVVFSISSREFVLPEREWFFPRFGKDYCRKKGRKSDKDE